MNAKLHIIVCCLSIALNLVAIQAEAQTTHTIITIHNGDADSSTTAGTGLDDPNPVPDPTMHGCSYADSWGQCRMRALQAAADEWASKLMSVTPGVEIKVNASMQPLPWCYIVGGSAILAHAGPTRAAVNFPNAPIADVAYSIAEADSLAGTPIYATGAEADPYDITLGVNLNLDTDSTSCLTMFGGWWYGTTAADTAALEGILTIEGSPYTVPLMRVVLHELAHGLGFTSMTDVVPPPPSCYIYSGDCPAPSDFSNGQYLTSVTLAPPYPTITIPPIWAYYIADASLGETWIEMTDAERAWSLSNDPYLVWSGPRTNAQAHTQLPPQPTVYFNVFGADSSLPTGLTVTKDYVAQPATFGPSVTTPVTGPLVLMNDGVVDTPITIPGSCSSVTTPSGTTFTLCTTILGSTSDGCEASTTDLTGKVVLIDAGYCSNTVKVANAQAAGATAVLIANNVGRPTDASAGGVYVPFTDVYMAQSIFWNNGANGVYTPTGTVGWGMTTPLETVPVMIDSVPTIPVYGISGQTRDLMVAYLTGDFPGYSPGLWPAPTVTLGFSSLPDDRAGTTAGCVRMYAPATLEPGSSVDHFHQDIIPHPLMAPNYNPVSLPLPDFSDVDLTTSLLADIGWNTSDTSGVPAIGAYNPCTIH